jgi:glycosyltransferase involved in cell wall biosynthesis
METLEEVQKPEKSISTIKLPVSVIIPVRNEAKNLPRCLQALRDVGEVYVIDSQSTDETVEIARSYGF